jgi:hypothetical protein
MDCNQTKKFFQYRQWIWTGLLLVAVAGANGLFWTAAGCGDDGGIGVVDGAGDGACDAAGDAALPDRRGPEAAVDGNGCITSDAAADGEAVDGTQTGDGGRDGGPQDGFVDGAFVDAAFNDGALLDAAIPDGALPDSALVDAWVPPFDAWVPPPDSGLRCPPEMVPVEGLFCIDIYEASRPDASASSYGSDETYATSRPGVKPWLLPGNPPLAAIDEARTACENAGKRLCQPWEWQMTCGGTQQTVYPYGDDYEPETCNGIDTFCHCTTAPCNNYDPCPYPHCYHQDPQGNEGGCGAAFHVTNTGAFANCTNDYGIYDISGNVWEVVDTNDGLQHFRGGAFNCYNSENLHRCAYDATWGPSAKGFRCCRDIQ